ncbi:exosortase-associated protein EpsI, B-type [Piscinibacter sp. XHJ-5]|uniref:exosortase-associated protein EpsI, B-type n=1 Tax=Piscinibacter sp. XHJ-5 TaxID=3037797 RepID=UPI00245355BA|nr:exosortase-associated protein EpsI, B-type [Piscinibacter sp. XHJ-5]
MSGLTTRRKAMVFVLTMGASAVLAEVARPRRRDEARARIPLAAIFPREFDGWRSDDATQFFVQPPDEQGKLYGVYDQLLQRTYYNAQGERIMLCVAYGSEQSPALQVHRPEICYAASGFEVTDTHRAPLSAGVRTLTATQLHARMVGRSEPITYWTVLGDSVVADEDAFRWRQWASALRGEIRDGMLVRVSSIGREATPGYRLHARFVGELARAVPAEHRDRVFGTPAA